MTKADAITAAHALGLAVYRSDTVAKIEARIAAHHAAKVERCSGVRLTVRKLIAFASVRTYTPRGPRQLFLPIAMPHNLIVACGVMAEG